MIPVNKITAIVVSDNKEDQREFRRTHKVSSMIPLPVKQFEGLKKYDLSGARCGRFTVIGQFDNGKKYLNGARWVVRCSCGRYEVKRTKTIKNPHDGQMCSECGITNSNKL